ncbi:MAG: hypothetical protein QM736_21725 [Vicinamibacterales bacterium]
MKKPICDNILDAIGDTPMVRINRDHARARQRDGARQDRDVQSWQLDQGPHGVCG